MPDPESMKQQASPLRVALIAPELRPFAQTGGLANMLASLSGALHDRGTSLGIFLPKYRMIPTNGFRASPRAWNISVGSRNFACRFWQGATPQGVPLYLLDIPELFDRPGLFGEGGRDYPDNGLRFTAFCRGVLEGMKAERLSWDILHLHDWQTALIPFYLKTLYQGDPHFAQTRSLFTIHNLSYQGIFPAEQYPLTGLPPQYFHFQALEFFGNVNFMKAGLVGADILTTVSPSYAQEVLTPELGCGLEGVLQERKGRFFGILNGIDPKEWNPQTDPYLRANYSEKTLPAKIKGKLALQRELGLEINGKYPLFGKVNRLVTQKGIDLIIPLLEKLLDLKLQIAILGDGDPDFQKILLDFGEKYPGKMAVKIGFDYGLSHRIIAGSDFILVPSLFEPCGYNQMFGQRYGAIPIARSTGGLRDTITDFSTDPDHGSGFLFQEPSPQALFQAMEGARTLYAKVRKFRALQRRVMGLDHSWGRSARLYEKLYRQALSLPPQKLPV